MIESGITISGNPDLINYFLDTQNVSFITYETLVKYERIYFTGPLNNISYSLLRKLPFYVVSQGTPKYNLNDKLSFISFIEDLTDHKLTQSYIKNLDIIDYQDLVQDLKIFILTNKVKTPTEDDFNMFLTLYCSTHSPNNTLECLTKYNPDNERQILSSLLTIISNSQNSFEILSSHYKTISQKVKNQLPSIMNTLLSEKLSPLTKILKICLI